MSAPRPLRHHSPLPDLKLRSTLIDIFHRLRRRFGPQRWWPARTRFEVCVGAILTQHAAWTGVERAIVELRRNRLLTPAGIARLRRDRLASLIAPAGCQNVRATRLLAFVRWLVDSGGFNHLASTSTRDLREQLLDVNGIGPETADAILLYALDRPVFVIDNYTRRILGRHGLARDEEPYACLQRRFHAALPRRARLYGEYHALLVRLGKTHCRVLPRCHDCPLAPRLTSGPLPLT